MDTIAGLRDTGLTEIESRVYLTSIKLGEALASAIAKQAEVNRSQAYGVLSTLQDKGLVSTVTKENRKYYRANDPEHLKKYVETKLNTAEELLPTLAKLYQSTGTRMNVEVYTGTRGLKTALREQLDAPEYFVIGAGPEFRDATKHFYEQYHTMRIERKVKSNVLYKHEARERAATMAALPYSDVAVLDSSYQVPFTIVIYGHKTALLSWPNSTAIVITEKTVADGFRSQYKILRAASERIIAKK